MGKDNIDPSSIGCTEQLCQEVEIHINKIPPMQRGRTKDRIQCVRSFLRGDHLEFDFGDFTGVYAELAQTYQAYVA